MEGDIEDDGDPGPSRSPASAEAPVHESRQAQSGNTQPDSKLPSIQRSSSQPPHYFDQNKPKKTGEDSPLAEAQTSVQFHEPNDPRTGIPSQSLQDYSRRRPWTQYAIGYPRYSAFIASDEDKSTTIFRRFQRLSARNLLYLESELSELEAEQDRLDELSQKDEELQLSTQSWDLLCVQATSGLTGEDPKSEGHDEESLKERMIEVQTAARQRLHLALRIREVLKTYHEALKLESEVLALKPPDRRPLKGARQIFAPSYDPRIGTGKKSAMIAGKMSEHLDEKNKQDLCILAPPTERDRLTRLFEGRFSYFFRTRTKEGLTDFVSHKKVSFAVTILSGLMAIIFLIGAILGLFWVTNPKAKLGMLSGLILAFAGTLALFTNARRQDVFAATAAYAAVLVVFVSGNLATDSTTSSNVGPQSVVPISTVVAFVTSTSVVTSTSLHIVETTPSSTIPTTAIVTSNLAQNTSQPQIASTAGPTLSLGQKLGLGLGMGLGAPVFGFCLWLYVRRMYGSPRKEIRNQGEPIMREAII